MPANKHHQALISWRIAAEHKLTGPVLRIALHLRRSMSDFVRLLFHSKELSLPGVRAIRTLGPSWRVGKVA